MNLHRNTAQKSIELSFRNSFYSPSVQKQHHNSLLIDHRSSIKKNNSKSPMQIKFSFIPLLHKQKLVIPSKFGKENISKVAKVLQIQLQAKKQFQRRLKTDSMLLKYNKNPFNVHPKSSQYQKIIKQTSSKSKTDINLIESLQNLLNKDVKQLFNQRSKNIAEKHARMKETLESLRKKQSKEAKNDNFDVQQILNQVFKFSKDELDSITKIKQNNFFAYKTNLQTFNLFQILTKPKINKYYSGNQQLQNEKFCFDSIFNQTSSKFNHSCLRDLSSYARIAILRSNSDRIPQDFKVKKQNLNFVLQQLGFSQIIQIASGQISSETTLSYLQFLNIQNTQINETKFNSDQEVDEDFNQNQLIKQTNIHADRVLSKTQFQQYYNLEMTKTQKNQQKVSMSYLIQMRQLLQKQLDLLNQKINDTSIHRRLQIEQTKICKKQLGDSANKTTSPLTSQRKIRLNKVNKDKSENIRIKTASKTLKEKQQVQNKIKNKSRRKYKVKNSK